MPYRQRQQLAAFTPENQATQKELDLALTILDANVTLHRIGELILQLLQQLLSACCNGFSVFHSHSRLETTRRRFHGPEQRLVISVIRVSVSLRQS